MPGQAFARSLEHGTLLISSSLIEELSDVLSRDKFDRYISREDRERFLESLIREAELVEICEAVQECRDPMDDHVLGLAISGNASYIVTGDSDLLIMDPFRGVRIVTPSKLFELFEETSRENET